MNTIANNGYFKKRIADKTNAIMQLKMVIPIYFSDFIMLLVINSYLLGIKRKKVDMAYDDADSSFCGVFSECEPRHYHGSSQTLVWLRLLVYKIQTGYNSSYFRIPFGTVSDRYQTQKSTSPRCIEFNLPVKAFQLRRWCESQLPQLLSMSAKQKTLSRALDIEVKQLLKRFLDTASLVVTSCDNPILSTLESKYKRCGKLFNLIPQW